MTKYLVLAFFLAASCSNPIDAPVDEPQELIVMKRAWLPGERDSTIARIQRDGGFGFFSPFADWIYADVDSVQVMVANPDFSVRAASPASFLVMAPRFASTWNVTGVRFINVNNNPVPPDTTVWTGLFWSNPTEAGWKGFILRGGTSATFTPQVVNTTAFDAANGKTGAGGGEARALDGTEWLANGPVIPNINTIEIQLAAFTTVGSVTSGPWTGGTLDTGSMQGRSKRVQFVRVTGSGPTNPANFEVDLDFRGGLRSVRLTCIFPSPCTTNVPAVMALLHQP